MSSWQIALGSLPVYVMVMIRMMGLIAFQPVLSRKGGIPAMAKPAFCIALTLVIAPTLPAADTAQYQSFDWLLEMTKQFFFGFAIGFVFMLFYYFLMYVGDIIDFQVGFSMARVMDPGTGVQSAVTGRLFGLLFSLYFFATNSHLALIHIFARSFQALPIGGRQNWLGVAGFMPELFISVFSLVLRLCLPFIAVEFILEISMGVLMKLIPQIHIFVINIQMKIFFGLLMLLIFAGPITGFLDSMLGEALESAKKITTVLAGL